MREQKNYIVCVVLRSQIFGLILHGKSFYKYNNQPALGWKSFFWAVLIELNIPFGFLGGKPAFLAIKYWRFWYFCDLYLAKKTKILKHFIPRNIPYWKTNNKKNREQGGRGSGRIGIGVGSLSERTQTDCFLNPDKGGGDSGQGPGPGSCPPGFLSNSHSNLQNLIRFDFKILGFC